MHCPRQGSRFEHGPIHPDVRFASTRRRLASAEARSDLGGCGTRAAIVDLTSIPGHVRRRTRRALGLIRSHSDLEKIV